MTTANSLPYATTNGKPSSSSKTTRAWVYGRVNSLTCAYQKFFNLRADPFERGDQSILYNKWMVDRASS